MAGDFSGEVIFSDHYMHRLAERYRVKPKHKHRCAAARALLDGLAGTMSERCHLLCVQPDGRMRWRLDIAGRSTVSVVDVRDGVAMLVTVLPRANSTAPVIFRKKPE